MLTSKCKVVNVKCTLLFCGCTHLVQGEENIGVVMVFTIVSALQEKLTHIVESAEEHKAAEKERLEKEVEMAEQVHC